MKTQLLLCISAVILLSLPANMDRLGLQETSNTLSNISLMDEFETDGKPTFTDEDYKRRIEELSGSGVLIFYFGLRVDSPEVDCD